MCILFCKWKNKSQLSLNDKRETLTTNALNAPHVAHNAAHRAGSEIWGEFKNPISCRFSKKIVQFTHKSDSRESKDARRILMGEMDSRNTSWTSDPTEWIVHFGQLWDFDFALSDWLGYTQSVPYELITVTKNIGQFRVISVNLIEFKPGGGGTQYCEMRHVPPKRYPFSRPALTQWPPALCISTHRPLFSVNRRPQISDMSPKDPQFLICHPKIHIFSEI